LAISIQSEKSPSSSGRVVSFEAMNSESTGKLNELIINRYRAARAVARGRIIDGGEVSIFNLSVNGGFVQRAG